MLSRSLILTGIGVALAAVLAIALIMQSRPSSSIQPPSTEGGSINTLHGPDTFILSGAGRSAIVVKADPENINMTRGESTTVTLSVSHRAGNNGIPVLHIIPTGIKSSLGLPSSNSTMNSEQRTELLKQGKPIPGTVDLSAFVSFSPLQLALNAGETKTIQMTITIPSTLPDEMVGKSIHFDPNLVISEMQSATPEKASEAVVFSDIVTVVVTK